MKNNLYRLLVLMVLSLSVVARADIFDRIDACERNGGGSCLYNLLRELARTSAAGSCRGVPHAGACWFRGNLGESCASVCSRNSLAYDFRTTSAENNEACQVIGSALGGKGNGQINGQSSCSGAESGTGCAYWPNGAASLFWCGGSTADAASSQTSRMCACI